MIIEKPDQTSNDYLIRLKKVGGAEGEAVETELRPKTWTAQ